MRTKDFRARLQAKAGKDVKERVYGVNNKSTNVCAPLWDTNGMLMPYTPAIQVTHTAVEYNQYSLPQTPFDYFAYAKRSSPMLSVTAMFTAQNQKEARYLLAVLHWLRGITMNYYGRENGNLRGLNPPTLLFSAYGPYMYHKVPMLIRNVSFGLDQDVDYVSCGTDSDFGYDANDGYGMYSGNGDFDGLKKHQYMDIGSITSDGFGYDNMETPIQGTMSVEEAAVSLEENIANSYVPAVIQPFIELVYAPTPSKMRDKFNLERFKSGQYLNDDGHNEGII